MEMDYRQFCREIGARIREIRLDRELTQEQLGQMIDRTAKYVRGVETGAVVPDLEDFLRISVSLEKLPETLLYDSDALAKLVAFQLAARLLTCLDDDTFAIVGRAYETEKSRRASEQPSEALPS